MLSVTDFFSVLIELHRAFWIDFIDPKSVIYIFIHKPEKELCIKIFLQKYNIVKTNKIK